MRISLTTEEREVLISDVRLPAQIAGLICASRPMGDRWILQIGTDDADEIRDHCGDALQERGFDERYEPTSVGKVLETLIDKFFIGWNSNSKRKA